MANTTALTTARRESTCPTCRKRIEAGTKIARRDFGPPRWSHASCIVTALRTGRTVTGGAFELAYITADGEFLGTNREEIAAAVAEYAPTRQEA